MTPSRPSAERLSPADVLAGALIAVEFLTLLRVRRVRRVDDRVFSAALGWYPFAGLVIGLALLLVDRGLSHLLPASPVAALEVALLALLTGGLHLDGVADTADGMAMQGDRAERLGVMSEGNTGPAGVMALALVLLAAWSALATLPQPVRESGLVLAPVLARWTVVPVALGFPAARPRGLGHTLRREMWPIAAPLATAIAVAAAVVLFGVAGLALLAFSGLVALLVAAAAARVLDGVTGDVFGAVIEIAQVATWFALIAAAERDWITDALLA